MVVPIAISTWIEIRISIDLHVKWFNWSMTFPKKSAKNCQALRLTWASSFQLHINFTCFKFITQIFGLFSSKYKITTREELSLQHSQRVGSYGQFQSWWTKSPSNSLGPSYFDIHTPVFVMRTLDSMYIKFKYVKWSTYIEFQVCL
jgi:hypothetical protein